MTRISYYDDAVPEHSGLLLDLTGSLNVTERGRDDVRRIVSKEEARTELASLKREKKRHRKLDKEVRRVRQAESALEMAELHEALADNDVRDRNLKAAHDHYMAAVRLLRTARQSSEATAQSDLDMLLTVALWGLGQTSQRRDNRTLALEAYEEGAGAARAWGSDRDEGHMLLERARLLQECGDLDEALKTCRRASELLKRDNDHPCAVAAWQTMAGIHVAQGQEKPARQAVLTAFRHARAIQTDRDIALVQITRATVEDRFGKPHNALADLRDAVRVLEKEQFPTAMSPSAGATDVLAALDELIELEIRIGQWPQALEHVEKRLQISTRHNERYGYLNALASRAYLQLLLADWTAATSSYQELLSAARRQHSRQAEVSALHGVAHVHYLEGRIEDAVETLERANEAAGAEKDLLEGFTRLRDAADDPEQALWFYRLSDHPGSAEISGLLDEVYVCAANGDLVGGRRALQRACDLATGHGDARVRAQCLAELGVVCFLEEDLDGARGYLRSAREECRRLGDRVGELTVAVKLARAERQLGKPTRAVQVLKGVPETAEALGDARLEVQARWQLGLALRQSPPGWAAGLRRARRRREGTAQLVAAISALDRTRPTVGGGAMRQRFLAAHTALFADCALALIEDGPDTRLDTVGRAFDIVERGRARTLLDLLSHGSKVRTGVSSQLSQAETAAQSKLASVRRQLVKARAQPVPNLTLVAELEVRERELAQEVERVQRRIRAEHPRYATLTQPSVWSLERVQRDLLDDSTVLLEYLLGEETTLLFCVRQSRPAEAFQLPGRREIEQLVRELRAAVVGELDRYPHGHRLYEILVEPAVRRGLIQPGDQLMIAPDGVLHLLPFACLLTDTPATDDGLSGPVSGEAAFTPFEEDESELIDWVADRLPHEEMPFDQLPYLVREHAITYLPSASVAGEIRQGTGPHTSRLPRRLLAIASPLNHRTPGNGRRSGKGKSPSGRGAGLEKRLADELEPVPIPQTVDEVWAIAAVLDPECEDGMRPEIRRTDRVLIRTAEAATKRAVLGLTAPVADEAEWPAEYAHFACHGMLDTERPEFCGLVLSAESRNAPLGYWHTFEIFNARLPARLVVLSACDTGRGRLVPGEGIVGLAHAFFYAGAQALCLSMWRTIDRTSPDLMREFYCRLDQGEGFAKALQAAQLEQTRHPVSQFRRPYYWAAYHLYGATDVERTADSR